MSAREDFSSTGGHGGASAQSGSAGVAGGPSAEAGSDGPVAPSCTGGPFSFAPAQSAWALGIDNLHLYWGDELDEFSHLLMRRPLGGGDVDLLWQSEHRILDIGMDDESVYVASGTNKVIKISKHDSTPLTAASGAGAVVSLAVDSSHLYYVDMTAGEVLRVAKGDDGVETIAADQQDPSNIALDSTHAYWIEEAHHQGVAAIRRVARQGGPVQVLVQGDSVKLEGFGRSTQDGLELSEARVFWVDEDGGTVYALDKEGGSPQQLLAGLKRPTALSFRDGHLYVAVTGMDYEGRGVVKIPEQGGSPTWIVSNPSYVPWEVELGEMHAYFTNPYSTGPITAACR